MSAVKYWIVFWQQCNFPSSSQIIFLPRSILLRLFLSVCRMHTVIFRKYFLTQNCSEKYFLLWEINPDSYLINKDSKQYRNENVFAMFSYHICLIVWVLYLSSPQAKKPTNPPNFTKLFIYGWSANRIIVKELWRLKCSEKYMKFHYLHCIQAFWMQLTIKCFLLSESKMANLNWYIIVFRFPFYIVSVSLHGNQ